MNSRYTYKGEDIGQNLLGYVPRTEREWHKVGEQYPRGQVQEQSHHQAAHGGGRRQRG